MYLYNTKVRAYMLFIGDIGNPKIQVRDLKPSTKLPSAGSNSGIYKSEIEAFGDYSEFVIHPHW